VYMDLDQGWNLIGDPFLWSTPLDCVLFRINETTYSLEEAVDEELLQPVLYNWLAGENNYTDGVELNPWMGYWFGVMVENIEMLSYPVLPQREDGRDEANEAIPEHWWLTIGSSIEGASDLTTTLGIDTNATDGFDIGFDFQEPPIPPGGYYVTAYFEHDDWNNQLGSRFNRDIRSMLNYAQEAEWTMSVQTSEETEVMLTWSDILETIPQDYQLILEDPVAGCEINMLEMDNYSYLSTGEREFSIMITSFNAIGGDKYGALPVEFCISNIHPNPFNSVTTIRYELPRPSHVSLTVNDLAGRLVETLVDKRIDAGRYAETWQAGVLPSGLYFVRFEASGSVQMQKVVLIR